MLHSLFKSAGPITRGFEYLPLPVAPIPFPIGGGMVQSGNPPGAPLADRTAVPFLFDANGLLKTSAGGAVPPAAPTPQIVRTVHATHFAGAITANDHATADLTGLTQNTGTILAVTVLALQNLDYEIAFWAADTYDDADLDNDVFIDSIFFNASDAMTIANATATTFRYAAHNIRIYYRDDDASNELHVSLIPRSANKLADGAGGDIVVEFNFLPAPL